MLHMPDVPLFLDLKHLHVFAEVPAAVYMIDW